MKKIFTVLATLLLSAGLWAQSPEKISYQAVIRDVQSTLLITKQVGMQISILQNSEDGTAVYIERQTPITNANGLVSIQIGVGTTSDDFPEIAWGADIYYIKTEIDPTGGTNYTITEVNQLLSVPYALHSKTAESLISPMEKGKVPVLTNEEIFALTPMKGNLVFSSNENTYQGYNGISWQSFSVDCWPLPTISNAGFNITSPNGTTTTLLSANTPDASHGIGEWTVENGEGGSFTDSNSPTTSFTGLLHEIYTLNWTISTSCSSSEDSIIVIFDQHDFGPELTDVEGNIYSTVHIGTQLWMSENLRVTKYADGTSIDNVTDNTEWTNLEDNNTDKAYCWYNNDSTAYSQTYGALYTSAAATNGDDSGNSVQGVCPIGWHLPSDAEWITLIDYIGGDGHLDTEGKALKSANGWNAYMGISYCGTDDYGFSALAVCSRSKYTGAYTNEGEASTWWSSTTFSSDVEQAYNYYLTYNYSKVKQNLSSKSYGFSVRCVKD